MKRLLIFFFFLSYYGFSQSPSYTNIAIRNTAKIEQWIIYQGDTLAKVETHMPDTLIVIRGIDVDTLFIGQVHIPFAATATNYTIASNSGGVAFTDLATNDTLALGSAVGRDGDIIYVARTDLSHDSLVITGTPAFYYKETGYPTFYLSKSASGCVIQSDNVSWYVVGVFYEFWDRTDILTVGDRDEQYSDFSTAVAAAVAGDVIEVSSITLTESGTVTMPQGSTLRIAEGGQLSGTFTLVGDSSRLDAGLYRVFGDNVTITGTWVVDHTLADWFGVDGESNESGELNKAIDFVELTTGKTLDFQNKHYYLEANDHNFTTDFTINGNGALLECTNATATAHYVISGQGTEEAYVYLDSNAIAGAFFIYGSGALLSLSQGDIVKIVDSTDFDGLGASPGEMKKVETVIGDRVFFTEPLNATYLADSGVMVAQVNVITPVIRDLNILQNGLDNAHGIYLDLTENLLIEGVDITDAMYTGITVSNGYNPIIDGVRTHITAQAGTGYGVSIINGTTNSIVTNGSFLYNRHGIAHGGASTNSGIPWRSLIKDCFAVTVIDAAFDAHIATGSVTFNNCTVKAGLLKSDTTAFYGVWDAAVTYAANDKVVYGEQILYSKGNGNVNHEPGTADGWDDWYTYYADAGGGQRPGGFNIKCDNVSIIDCHVYNAAYGTVVVYANKNVTIDGLYCRNMRVALTFGNSPTSGLYESTVNNIILNNDYYTEDASALLLASGATLMDVGIGDIIAINANGLLVTASGISDINISKLNVTKGYSVVGSGQAAALNLSIDELITADNIGISCIYLGGTTYTSFKIDNADVTSLKTRFIQSAANIGNYSVNSLNVNSCGVVSDIFYSTDTIASLNIGNVYVNKAVGIPMFNNGSVITAAAVGTLMGNISDEFSGTEPVYVVLAGKQTGPYLSADGANVGVWTAEPTVPFEVTGNSKITGNLTLTGLLAIPTTSSTVGQITLNGNRFLHGYGTNNTFAGTNSGNFTLTGTGNTTLGLNTLINLTDGTNNTFIGMNGGINVRGDYNTGVGMYAGYGSGSYGTGDNNTMLGAFSQGHNSAGWTTAYDNTSSGYASLYSNQTGDNNTANGSEAGYSNTTGGNNTFIGKGAGRSNAVGIGNVFLGYLAGYNETGNNRLFIENSNADSTGALIFGNFGTDKVVVNGTLSSDNTYGELFEDSPTVKATVAVYRTIVSLQAGDYNEATLGDSSITVLQAGVYMVQYHASFTHSVNNTICHLSFFVDDVENTNLEDEQKVGVAGDVGSVAGSCLVSLSANDVLKIKATSDNAGNLTINHFNFNVVRIK